VIAVLGILSGCLTTLSWVPQLLRTWRRGHADDISGMYLFTFGTGVVGWIVYGAFKADVAVIFANALTVILLAGLLAMKYGRTAAPVDRSAPENARQSPDAGAWLDPRESAEAQGKRPPLVAPVAPEKG
jgi:MtN3 and saliva related transmembrane protein